MFLTEDMKCPGKYPGKLRSLKLGIFVLEMDHYIVSPRTVNVSLKQNENNGNAMK